MLNVGDVVFGKFATPDGKVLRHYSVVLQSNREGAVLVYTTSMKENQARANPAQRFTAEDMARAGFEKACLWDASRVSVVPATELKKTGSVTRSTLGRIVDAYTRALRGKSLQMAMLQPCGAVVAA